MGFLRHSGPLIAALALGVAALPAGAAPRGVETGFQAAGAIAGLPSQLHALGTPPREQGTAVARAGTRIASDESAAGVVPGRVAIVAGPVVLPAADDYAEFAADAVSAHTAPARGPVVRLLARVIPEPVSFLLVVSGLLAFGYARSREVKRGA